MKKIKLLSLALIPVLGSSTPTFAATKTCGTVKTSVISCGGGNVINSLLITVVNFLAIGVGLAVVTGIVIGAIMYTTAGSSADQAKRGIGYIRNAIIALVLYIFLFAAVNFLVPGGLF